MMAYEAIVGGVDFTSVGDIGACTACVSPCPGSGQRRRSRPRGAARVGPPAWGRPRGAARGWRLVSRATLPRA